MQVYSKVYSKVNDTVYCVTAAVNMLYYRFLTASLPALFHTTQEVQFIAPSAPTYLNTVTDSLADGSGALLKRGMKSADKGAGGVLPTAALQTKVLQ